MAPLIAYDEAQGEAPEPPRWLLPAIAAAAAAHIVVFAALLVVSIELKPYSDAYRFVFDAWRWRNGEQGFLSYLWSPHVGHHMAWVRLATAFEVATVRSAWPSVLAGSLALIGAAGLIAWRASRDPRIGAVSALLCAMLVLTGFNALDASQPLNTLYSFCLVFAVAALSLWTLDAPSTLAFCTTRGAALLAAMAAAVGNGAALALWPILAGLALTSPRHRWPSVGAAILVGGVFSAIYLAGATEVSDLIAGGGGDASLLRRLLYFFNYIALPWSELSPLGGAVLGAAITAIAAGAIHLSRQRGATPLDRFAWGLIGFTLLTALLAAAARSGLGAELRVPMRYAPFAAPLQAGVVILLKPELEGRFSARPGVIAAVLLGPALLLLVQQAASGVYVLRSHRTVSDTIADYEAGRRTPLMTQLIYPDLAFADRVEARLRAEGSFGKAPAELAQPKR